MPYIGNAPAAATEESVTTVDNFAAGVGFTAGSSTTVTLTSTPASENSLLVTMDGVTQHHNTYSVSGTTLTFDTAIPTGTSNIEVVHEKPVSVGTIADNGVTTSKIADNTVTPAKISGAINAQTGTTYTLVIGDAFKTVTMSNGSANTLTIPPNSSVAFAVGDRIDVVMLGSGTTSVVGGSGVTLNGDASSGTGAIAAQYASVSCLKIATDTWLLIGNHGGVS